ncbi:MAG: quercetin 2,3-dioxygenase [Desulfuromonas sp.]|nr:MAG: quercetin 2,3-dioxygenase [Desulfuromonas sp.]
MLEIRPSGERGHFEVDWLNSYHTFSFSNYYDPEHMGFRQLRVINEDRVQPGGGFPTHPHQDMEILSLVLAGELKHEDSSGNSEIIPAGGVQLISAGTGVRHSEYNPSNEEVVHFFQIWIHPERSGLEPGYRFARFDLQQPDIFIPIANRRGTGGAVQIHQDAGLDFLNLTAGSRVERMIVPGRHAWVQVAKGEVNVNGVELAAGDGLAVSQEKQLDFSTGNGTELLLFDLA